MDLSTLSLVELQALQQQIPTELKRREEAEKQAFMNEMRELAASRGLSLDDVLGKSSKKGGRAGGSVKAKYRHPGNPALQWTGRGRQPLWVVEQLNQGKTLNDLMI